MTRLVKVGDAQLSKGVWNTVQKLRNIADSFEHDHMPASAGAMREAIALIIELEGKLRKQSERIGE
jgi:hypothetical protein